MFRTQQSLLMGENVRYFLQIANRVPFLHVTCQVINEICFFTPSNSGCFPSAHSIRSFNISIYRIDSQTVFFTLSTHTVVEPRPTPNSGTRSPTFDLHSHLSPSMCCFTGPQVRLRLSKPQFPTVVLGSLSLCFSFTRLNDRAV